MPHFIISYLGGNQPSTPEEGKQHRTKYMDWLASLGGAVLSPANPFKDTTTVNSDGSISLGGTTSMSGYTLIDTDSIEKALEIAKSCPFLDIGGMLEVSEIIKMPT